MRKISEDDSILPFMRKMDYICTKRVKKNKTTRKKKKRKRGSLPDSCRQYSIKKTDKNVPENRKKKGYSVQFATRLAIEAMNKV